MILTTIANVIEYFCAIFLSYSVIKIPNDITTRIYRY